MIEIRKHLEHAVTAGASDILVISGMPISYKLGAELVRSEDEPIMPALANEVVTQLFEMAGRPMDKLNRTGDDDFPLSIPGLSRFRVSAYRQRGSLAAAIRVICFDIPDPCSICIPEEVMKISEMHHGLVLVTGPSGNGKSTTLACIVDKINSTRQAHIITLEDPVEYLHRNKVSAVSQREIGSDTESYVTAMRACLRQTPDVILLGEMRDYETICAAVTAAETGHLLLSTLHTVGAVNTIDRIIDVFPASQQQQIRIQLSQVLRTVVCQQLLPGVDGGVVPVFEIMYLNSAVRNMIRESKTHQIDSVIQSSASEGMLSMDNSIIDVYRQGKITRETAIKFALNAEQMERKTREI
ncbi:MAG: PilT/PilU family type 4a pilus ATPase [Clostridia bacterium]|nr:PilT/PilU family type 4a pilus ATPase [Clostridia bacterium]